MPTTSSHAWCRALGLALAVLGIGSSLPPARADDPPDLRRLLAENPQVHFAGAWTARVKTKTVDYTLHANVIAGQRQLDGHDRGAQMFFRVTAPAEHAGKTADQYGGYRNLRPGVVNFGVGADYGSLPGLVQDSSGFGAVTDLRLSPDGMRMKGQWSDNHNTSTVEFERIVPRIEKVVFPPDMEAALTRDILEREWVGKRKNGKFPDWQSPHVQLDLTVPNFRPGWLPGLVIPEDPRLLLHSSWIGEDGIWRVRFILDDGTRPGRKRVHVSGGVSFEFDLRIQGFEDNPPKLRPEILAVVVLDDQSRLPYPEHHVVAGHLRRRRLFVAGMGLPKTRVESSTSVLRGHEPVTYEWMGTPDDATPGSARAPEFARGWKWSGLTPNDDVSAVIIDARLGPGVHPGRKQITIDGASAPWLLEFSDNVLRVAFTRDVRDGEREATSSVVAGETFFLDVECSAPLPLGEIPLELSGPAGVTPVVAKREREHPGSTKRRYRTGPLSAEVKRDHVVAPAAGAQVVPAVAGERLHVVLAEPDVLRLEPEASARVVRDPADLGATWDQYVQKAAVCAQLDLERAKDQLAKQVADAMRFIVSFRPSQFGHESESITLGDHAAALLLRDAFLAKMKALRATYAKILASPTAVRSFRLVMARSAGDQRQPLNVLAVTGPRGEGKRNYADVHTERLDGLTPEQLVAWQDEATREALTALVASMDTSIAYAEGGSDCEVERWVMLTSLGFEDVVASVTPRLLKRRVDAHGRVAWEPDLVARAYVQGLHHLGSAIRGLEAFQRVARGLTGLVMLPAFFGGGYLLASEGLYSFLLGLAITAVDVAIPAADIAEYLDDQAERDFARGAAPVIGLDRLDVIERSASGKIAALATVLGVVAPGLGALAATADRAAKAVQAKKLADAARRGEELVRARGVGEQALDGMSAAERADTVAYYAVLKGQELADGAETLTDAQRAFVRSLDTLADSKTPSAVPGFKPAHAPGTPGPLTGVRIARPGGDLVLGPRLGKGGFNEVYAIEGNAGVVARFALAGDAGGEALERFGRAALTGAGPDALGKVDPNAVRVARRFGDGIADAKAGAATGRRFELVERMPDGSAAEQLGGARMSLGQAKAVNDALRELNARGLAWTDAHTGNFAFERVGAAGDAWRVVVIDPGGIVPATGKTLAERAANARTIQVTSATPPPGVERSYAAARANPNPAADVLLDRLLKEDRNRVFEAAEELVDWTLLGAHGRVPVSDLGMVQRGFNMIDQPEARALLVSNDPTETLRVLQRSRGAPPRRVRPGMARRPCRELRRRRASPGACRPRAPVGAAA